MKSWWGLTASLLRRMRKFLVMVLGLSLLLNTNFVRVSAAPPGGKVSTDQSTPRNAQSLKWFKEDPTVASLLKEADIKGHSIKFDNVVFIEGDANGTPFISVTVGGHRGKSESVLVTGYFDPSSGSVVLAHALYFRQQGTTYRIENTTYAKGQMTTNGASYNSETGSFVMDDGRQLSAQSSGVTFGQTALADVSGPYTCQKTECQMTYILWSYLACGLLALLTEGLLVWACGLVAAMLPTYICNTIYSYCP